MDFRSRADAIALLSIGIIMNSFASQKGGEKTA